MKATVEGIEVEGTPAEIAELHRVLSDRTPLRSNVDSTSGSEIDLGHRMTVSVAMKVLKRKPLSDAQRSIVLKLASEHPKWVSFEELQRSTSYSKAQLSGALGAFGRRLAATTGYKKGMLFLHYDFDEEAGSWNYFLDDAAFAAIQRVEL